METPFSMDEIAAAQIVLDIQIIALFAMILGIVVYGVHRRKGPAAPRWFDARVDRFDGLDFLALLFPLAPFLFKPYVSSLTLAQESPPPAPPTDPDASLLTSSILVSIFLGVMVYGILVWVRGRDLKVMFGLDRLRLSKIVLAVIVWGVASLVICMWLLATLSTAYIGKIFTNLSLQEPVRLIQESSDPLQLVLAVIAACVVAPLLEEFLFRGYFYGALRQFTTPFFAAMVVGALFATVHVNLPALVPLWGFSLLLCAAYEVTRCLWVTVGMHAIFNGANIILMLTLQTDS
jgi:membrane protease YdiL (CAAX protease family)